MKLLDHSDRKIVNAIMFFASRVKYPFKLKIFKLLFFLDYIHFKETGRPVTNLLYKAYPMGPVPERLYEAINERKCSDYFNRNLKLIERPDIGEGALQFNLRAGRKPNMETFSPREIRILEEVTDIYKNSQADEMSEITHLKNSPWEKTINEKGRFQYIDYMLALDDEAEIPKELAAERKKESEEMRKIFT